MIGVECSFCGKIVNDHSEDVVIVHDLFARGITWVYCDEDCAEAVFDDLD